MNTAEAVAVEAGQLVSRMRLLYEIEARDFQLAGMARDHVALGLLQQHQQQRQSPH